MNSLGEMLDFYGTLSLAAHSAQLIVTSRERFKVVHELKRAHLRCCGDMKLYQSYLYPVNTSCAN